jgi:acyl-CoA reductase-like NAD-dependent aldehyde dehydrogenase
MGPIVSEAQLARVMSYVDAGRAQAQLLAGGARATGGALDKGLFVEPTIFDKAPADATIVREEIFGPVLTVIPFATADDALRLANDTMYGLAAAVWTKHVDTALRMARGIRAGTVWVNTYHGTGASLHLPYGGYKQSGVGRELGRAGLDEYLEWKGVHLKLGSA